MHTHLTDRPCKSLLSFSGVLVLAALAATSVAAQGPKPEYDFTIEMGDTVPLVVTGAVDEVYRGVPREFWHDDEGVAWWRVRFYHTLSEDYYFEVDIPQYPEHGIVYEIQLTAGPNGYLSHGTLYEGVWAAGTCTGYTRERWHWWIEPYTGVKQKYRVLESTWDLAGFLLP